VHSREAGGALADGKTAMNGLFSRNVRACSARFANFSGLRGRSLVQRFYSRR
jgi:hypothetical protein